MGRRGLGYGVLLPIIQLLAGCSQETPAHNGASAEASLTVAPVPVTGEKLIVAFGDSLFAGYNLSQNQGFAPVLERALNEGGIKARVVNAGVSGDTSGAGLQRLGFVLDGLERKPDLVIVELGANDMLRGLSPASARSNLDAIVSELNKRGIDTMLTGMVAAPNLGRDYAKAFNAIYPDLAKKFGLTLDPFLLEGVVGRRELLLPDGMHPNDEGVKRIVARLSPTVVAKLSD